MANTNGRTSPQNKAIAASIMLGKNLQVTHPQIAEMWRDGKTQIEIAEELGLAEQNGEEISAIAVNKAICGHREGYNIEPYVGLVPEEERKKIAKKAHQRNASKLFDKVVSKRTSNQWTQIARKGIVASLAAQGMTRYAPRRDLYNFVEGSPSAEITGEFPSEKESIVYLSKLPGVNYDTTRGEERKKKLERICDEINRIFNNGKPVRSTEAVRYIIYLSKNPKN